MNPSDNTDPMKAMVFSNHVRTVDLDANVENVGTKSRKAYRKELKAKRLKGGDAASGDF